MPRGRLLRTKVKEEKALVMARLKTEAKFDKSPEGLMKTLKEKFGEALTHINPLELGATVALTYFIHQTLVEFNKPPTNLLKPRESALPGTVPAYQGGSGFGDILAEFERREFERRQNNGG